MAVRKSPKLRFNCYLLREDVSDFDSALRPKYRKGGTEQLTKIEATSKAPKGSIAYYGSTSPKTPKWAEMLESSFKGVGQAVNSAHRLLVCLPVDQRKFVVCFGQGNSALEWDAIESSFGLQVAARMMKPDKLTELRSRRVDTSARTQEISMAAGGTLEALGADVDGEYVRKLIGKQDSGDGMGLKGAMIAGDSIAFQHETNLHDVQQVLKEMLRLVNEDDPTEEFSFIDSMEPLRSGQRIVLSLKELIKRELISASDPKEYENSKAEIGESGGLEKYFLEVALPDDVKFEDVEVINVIRGTKSFVMEEISILELQKALRNLKVQSNTEFLKNVKLLAMKADGTPASIARPLLDWLIFEAGNEQDRYVLTLGKWFRFDREFTARLNYDLSSIPDLTGKFNLPNWTEGEHEEQYCIRVEESKDDFALFDRFRLKNSGNSMVEVCDLFHKEGHLIHVKRDRGAPTLSHLFAQGEVSAALLVYDDEFRANFINEATSRGSGFTKAAKSVPEYVTYAVAHKKPDRAPLNLPTFSKINLRSHVNRLRGMKIKVSIARIVIN